MHGDKSTSFHGSLSTRCSPPPALSGTSSVPMSPAGAQPSTVSEKDTSCTSVCPPGKAWAAPSSRPLGPAGRFYPRLEQR